MYGNNKETVKYARNISSKLTSTLKTCYNIAFGRKYQELSYNEVKL